MKGSLYPAIATLLLVMLVLTKAFEQQINDSSVWVSIAIFTVASLICFGLVLLASWDCESRSSRGNK